MSEFENVTRFEHDMDCSMVPSEYGGWVDVDDYFKLLEAYKVLLVNQSEYKRLLASQRGKE
jgi:hypothetical protein